MADYNFKHEQHKKEFFVELSSTKNKSIQPFRMLDEVMIVGKYKGMKLSEVPTYYLRWLLTNYRNLNNNSKIHLNKIINDR